jgi:phenylalanyl-tRNA synthetase beta chain
MLVSLEWLRSYVECDASADEIADRLTMAGLEVESVERYQFGMDHVRVARIHKVEQHPHADHLTVCEMEIPEGMVRVVCGAANVAEGQLVPLALEGARLIDDTEVRAAKIYGVDSQGMLCSEKELGLGENAEGIMILPAHLVPGISVAEALGLSDEVLDLEITPNRPDCLSLTGIAREVAALFDLTWFPPSITLNENGPPVESLASVTIEDPDLCPRYAARVIQNMTVKPSPLWMRRRLEAQGVRAINNIVDVTNWVMLELGQPLHAFDYHRLAGHCIVVRRARPQEELVTLDGQRHQLQKDMLLICDQDRAVALAGIMGGLDSEISADTNTVLIESAHFDPTTTRRTAKALGLNTESGYRFERRVDPEGVLTALDRAAQLMVELGGGELASGRLDVYPAPTKTETVSLRVSKTNRFLGVDLAKEEIVHHLKSIQLEVRDGNSSDLLEVDPPSFRPDLTREVDLMEEVARLAGFDRIPSALPVAQVSSTKPAADQVLQERVKQILAGLGFCEVISYSFISSQAVELLQLAQSDRRRQLLPLRNPLSEDQAVMRTSLIPGMLETAARNQRQSNFNLRLVELSKVFFSREDQDLPEERLNLCGLIAGSRRPASWSEAAGEVDFFDAKGAIEALLVSLSISGVRWSPKNPAPYLRGDTAVRILLGETILGDLGQIRTEVAQAFDLIGEVFLFDMDFDLLLEKSSSKRSFQLLPKFPAVNRDLAVVVSQSVSAQDLLDFLESNRPEYTESIAIFDEYRGDQVGKEKRSLAFRITYRSAERSLTDREVNEIHNAYSEKVVRAFQAEFR